MGSQVLGFGLGFWGVLSLALAAPSVGVAAESVVTPEGNAARVVLNRHHEFEITERVRVKLDGADDEAVLFLEGRHGTRKSILGASYQISNYLPKGEQLGDPDDALDAVAALSPRVLRLHVAMSLSARTLKNAFTSALVKNGVVVARDAAVKALFDKLTFAVAPGDTIDFVCVRSDDGSDEVSIHVSTLDKPLVGKGRGLGRKFWSIWFGNPVDADMRAVRAALVGQP